MRPCSHCGFALDNGMRMCPQCRQRQTLGPVVQPFDPPRQEWLVVAVLRDLLPEFRFSAKEFLRNTGVILLLCVPLVLGGVIGYHVGSEVGAFFGAIGGGVLFIAWKCIQETIRNRRSVPVVTSSPFKRGGTP
jgi:hypothetical protein